MVDVMTLKQATTAIQNETDRKMAISTEFGVVDITKKEAIRMLDTCETSTICISLSPGQFILEYPQV